MRVAVCVALLAQLLVTSTQAESPCSCECSDEMGDDSCPLDSPDRVSGIAWLALFAPGAESAPERQCVGFTDAPLDDARPTPPACEILHVPKTTLG